MTLHYRQMHPIPLLKYLTEQYSAGCIMPALTLYFVFSLFFWIFCEKPVLDNIFKFPPNGINLFLNTQVACYWRGWMGADDLDMAPNEDPGQRIARMVVAIQMIVIFNEIVRHKIPMCRSAEIVEHHRACPAFPVFSHGYSPEFLVVFFWTQLIHQQLL